MIAWDMIARDLVYTLTAYLDDRSCATLNATDAASNECTRAVLRQRFQRHQRVRASEAFVHGDFATFVAALHDGLPPSNDVGMFSKRWSRPKFKFLERLLLHWLSNKPAQPTVWTNSQCGYKNYRFLFELVYQGARIKHQAARRANVIFWYLMGYRPIVRAMARHSRRVGRSPTTMKMCKAAVLRMLPKYLAVQLEPGFQPFNK